MNHVMYSKNSLSYILMYPLYMIQECYFILSNLPIGIAEGEIILQLIETFADLIGSV